MADHDHHHETGTTVVETGRDSSTGIIVGVLVALLIVFLIWLFLFGPLNMRSTDDVDNNPDVTNIEEGDTNVDVNQPDTGGDTTGGDTGGSGQTTP